MEREAVLARVVVKPQAFFGAAIGPTGSTKISLVLVASREAFSQGPRCLGQ